MNKFVKAIKELDAPAVEQLIGREPKWLTWAEDDGKNALHYLCGVEISKHSQKAEVSLHLLKLFLNNGMDINSVHRIKDGCGIFPATPLWYAYTRGRNQLLFKHLLNNGADPEHCMYAIAWYDDADAAELFKSYGAAIDDHSNGDTPFIAAFTWKRFAVAEWFLKNGADVNATDNKGNPALFYAVKRKYKTEQIELLLHYGADIDQQNNEGISPKQLALAKRQLGILKMFNR